MKKLRKMQKKLRLLFFVLLCVPFIMGTVFNAGAAEDNKDKAVIATEAEGEAVAEAEDIKEKPLIHYVIVEGIVEPAMGEFIVKSIDDATKANAELIVFQLDTPGGLDLSMRVIIKSILSSDVPVVVYVAPPGARAASAGVFITYASHVAAMAPGTNMGSAHPVAMGGGEIDETMMAKVENDAAAYIKSIAEKKGRNAEWAEKAVRESVNITAEEALKLNVIEILAENRDELFKEINGRTVDTITGKVTIKIDNAEVVEIEPGIRLSILKTIANPNVAYILMMIGMMGIYFELSNPGMIFPGVVGAICLILAFYSFQTLPVNYAGLALILLGLILFIAEVKIVSFGLLTIAGIICLTLGSVMLFDSPMPFIRISFWVVLPTVLMTSTAMAMMMYLAVQVHKKNPVSGLEALMGDEGRVEDEIHPPEHGYVGHVFIEGEYWKAVSDVKIVKGEQVKVVGIDGLLLKVKKV